MFLQEHLWFATIPSTPNQDESQARNREFDREILFSSRRRTAKWLFPAQVGRGDANTSCTPAMPCELCRAIVTVVQPAQSRPAQIIITPSFSGDASFTSGIASLLGLNRVQSNIAPTEVRDC